MWQALGRMAHHGAHAHRPGAGAGAMALAMLLLLPPSGQGVAFAGLQCPSCREIMKEEGER
jgi:hypothetical protein